MGQRSQIYIRYNVNCVYGSATENPKTCNYKGLIARYYGWNYEEELLDNVEVEPLQPLPVIRQLYTFYFPVQFSHNLVDTRFTIIGFHVEKSPAMMCLRASPTSHR